MISVLVTDPMLIDKQFDYPIPEQTPYVASDNKLFLYLSNQQKNRLLLCLDLICFFNRAFNTFLFFLLCQIFRQGMYSQFLFYT